MAKYTMEVSKTQALITLEVKGKTYQETWVKKGRGEWGTTGKGIEKQIEDGLNVSDVLYDLFDAMCEQNPTEIMQALCRIKD